MSNESIKEALFHLVDSLEEIDSKIETIIEEYEYIDGRTFLQISELINKQSSKLRDIRDHLHSIT